MKPINLEMSAFGPYKNSVSIDFSKMGENGIFLITGDTGAGKTTIFDGIMYALYGSVSGSNRQVNTIRSDFADNGIQTYVELVFSHKGKIYKIRRSPQYERPKKTGEGTTLQLAEAHIEQDGKILASGVGNVDNKVKEILSIDVKQFKQISMLAQGEFLKILFAESKERTEIFRKIFDTYVYESIKDKLYIKQKEAYVRLNNYKTKFLTNTNNIIWEEKPDFISVLSEKNIHTYLNEILNLLEIEVKKNEESLAKIKKEVDELENSQKLQEFKINQAEIVNSNFAKLEDLLKKEEDLLNQKANIDLANNKIDKTQKIQAEILPKLNLLLKAEVDSKKINNEIQEKNKLLQELEAKKNEYNEKEVKITELKNHFDLYNNISQIIEKYQTEIESIKNIENVLVEFDKDKVSFNLLKLKEEAILRLKVVYKEYESLMEKNRITQEELIKILDIENYLKEREDLIIEFDIKNGFYRKIEDKYMEEENKFYREQAGILAEKLEENKPCPVCGSINHPNVAVKSDALSKEELDLMKNNLQKAEKEKNQVNERLTIKNTQIDALSNGLKYDKDKNTLLEYMNIIKEVSKNEQKNIQEKLDEVNKIYFSIVGKKLEIGKFDFDEFKKEFDINLKNIENNLTKNETLIDNFKQNMNTVFSEKNILNEYINDVKSKFLGLNEDLDNNKNVICNLYKDIVNNSVEFEQFDFEKIKDQFENEKQNYLKKLIEIKVKIEELKRQLEEKNKEVLVIKNEYENSYKKLGFKDEAEYKEVFLNNEDLEKCKKEVDNYKIHSIEIAAKIKELQNELKDKVIIDLNQDKEELEKIKNKLIEKQNEKTNINYKYTSNKRNWELLNNDSEDVKKQIDTYIVLDELYKTASGNLAGKRRIDFEQYVQASFFDMILNEANKRLVKMTNSRYELVRKEVATKLNDKIGLDIEVIDNYTGKRRDVKSLSGGESFKAALSLALGVSDVIQSYSGGVIVDTLFIDEGFGSLDVESRAQAINTLNMLTNNNKLIGIISHVTELKENIDKKIIIEKTTEGSKIHFE